METLWQDLKHGFRLMIESPELSAAVVIALAIGIGANTAIFSVINAVILQPLPFPEPDRLVTVWASSREGETYYASYPDLRDFQEQTRSFDRLAAFRTTGYSITGEGEAEWVGAVCATSDFFPTVGVNPVLGRAFTPEEDRPEGGRAVVLSHGLWQRRYGKDPGVLGRSVRLGGDDFTVVGVLPPDFVFPLGAEDADVWTTLAFEGGNLESRGAQVMKVVGRLAPGATVAGAQDELDAVASRLEQQFPDTNADKGARVVGLQDRISERVSSGLWILFAAVGFVLLIACANVANLLLVRTSARQRELLVRSALGASRGRIVRQLLTESLALAAVGGAAGLGLAVWGIDLLVYLGPDDIPRVNDIGLDTTVLAFTLLLSLATGVLFGTVPALRTLRRDLGRGMAEGGRGSTDGPGRVRLRGMLVACETALALVLLVAAGLLVESFARLVAVDPGFDPRNVLTMRLAINGPQFVEDWQRADFVGRVLDEVRALPGIESAAFVTPAPFSRSDVGSSFSIVGRPGPEPGNEPSAQFRGATPDYVRTLRIPLLAGRDLTDRDRKGGVGAALIDEEAARRYWPGEDPLGQRITSVGVGVDEGEPTEWEVVGVVGNVKHRGLDEEARPEIYLPHRQQSWDWGDLVVRTTIAPTGVADAVRGTVARLDKDVPTYNVHPLDEMIDVSLARQRFYTMLLGAFAVAGLVLAAVGIYGVSSYSVAERTHEIGVRMALGARREDILRIVVGGGMTYAMAGLAAGLLGALAVSQAMAGLLFGISATDPTTFVVLAAVLALVALFACYVPARRATKVDPMIALRCE